MHGEDQDNIVSLLELKNGKLEPETEYEVFKEFFDWVFKKPRKCKLTKDAIDIGDDDTPLLSLIECLQSRAIEIQLKKSNVTPHLYRYIKEMAPTLLIDIPIWDGRDRIKEICQFIKLKDNSPEILEDYLKAWGAGIFKKANDSRFQNTFIILKGDQGIGKDRLVSYLCEGFKNYYTHFHIQPNRETDAYHQVHANLVLHLEEFDQSFKMGVAFLKELITVQEKTFRLPYERVAMRRKMNASFISTVNVEDIFRDATGNRRFAVFDIEAIDWAYPKDSSQQVMAQFKALYEQGYQLKEENKQSMKAKVERMTPDSMEGDIVELWIERCGAIGRNKGQKELPYADVADVIKGIAQITDFKIQKIQMILGRHHFSYKRGGTKYYTWIRQKEG